MPKNRNNWKKLKNSVVSRSVPFKKRILQKLNNHFSFKPHRSGGPDQRFLKIPGGTNIKKSPNFHLYSGTTEKSWPFFSHNHKNPKRSHLRAQWGDCKTISDLVGYRKYLDTTQRSIPWFGFWYRKISLGEPKFPIFYFFPLRRIFKEVWRNFDSKSK